jgi:carbamoyltransferase
MLICGIHDGHNAAAALVKDGQLLGALQEERLRRVKNWAGFPDSAIQTLLHEAGAGWADVDAWVFAGRESYLPPSGSPGDRQAQVRAYKQVSGCVGAARRVLRRTPLRRLVQQVRQHRRLVPLLERGVPRTRIHTVEHHACHAATAYYGAGADQECIVFTLDGAGDGICATVAIPDKSGQLRRLSAIPEEDSIGILWALLTSYLGMVPLEHEYKIMGLAPYAASDKKGSAAALFERAFVLENGTWRRARGVPEINYSYRFWRRNLELIRFDHIAEGLQSFTERLVAGWVSQWCRRLARSKVRLSGGVFMNVKLNKVLSELCEIEDLFVFPSCGDETNAIGAAWVYLEECGLQQAITPIGPLYLGPSPAEQELNAAVRRAKEAGCRVTEVDWPAEAVARLLADGEVVARYAGRDEFGARALGNRSILADPRRLEAVREINRMIKCRDFWMPFAPTVLDIAESQYVVNPKRLPAHWMILSFDSRNSDEIAAAVHAEDRTVRPQVLHKGWNPDYYEIIERFGLLTGRFAVLNTSFNVHGEPIVSRPDEAVDVLLRSGLKHLLLGRNLVQKSA